MPEATVSQRAEAGRTARKQAPRASQSELRVAPDRDPIALLEEQARSRLPELVPVRYGRMLTSPFAFFRGAAIVMAHDLVGTPAAGLSAQLCGDAHLANFGGFASPERDLVFDLNDFDETLPGPFEWDIKRLVTSFEIAGRDLGFEHDERRTATRAAVCSYREGMREMAGLGDLDVWYARLDARLLAQDLERESGRGVRRRMRRAEADA